MKLFWKVLDMKHVILLAYFKINVFVDPLEFEAETGNFQSMSK